MGDGMFGQSRSRLPRIAASIAFGLLALILTFNGIAAIVNPQWWVESEWTLSNHQCRTWLSDGVGLWQFRALGVMFLLILLVLLGFFVYSL